jgi:cytoplasmic iron level regulating protein YaaA (DUF328/UPF0246 family)
MILLSPAKNLDETPRAQVSTTKPELLDDAFLLLNKLQDFSVRELADLLGVSEKIAELNYRRYQNLAASRAQSFPAAWLFNGEVYSGLDFAKLSQAAQNLADLQLRILSGFYGILRPRDAIFPYRLEMGIALANQRGKNLYEFWREKITENLAAEIVKNKQKILVNLASAEYAKSVDFSRISADLLVPVFRDRARDGSYKTVMMYAKRARGLMARFILEDEIKNKKDLQKFNSAGYRFSAADSNEQELVFLR